MFERKKGGEVDVLGSKSTLDVQKIDGKHSFIVGDDEHS